MLTKQDYKEIEKEQKIMKKQGLINDDDNNNYICPKCGMKGGCFCKMFALR